MYSMSITNKYTCVNVAKTCFGILILFGISSVKVQGTPVRNGLLDAVQNSPLNYEYWNADLNAQLDDMEGTQNSYANLVKSKIFDWLKEITNDNLDDIFETIPSQSVQQYLDVLQRKSSQKNRRGTTAQYNEWKSKFQDERAKNNLISAIGGFDRGNNGCLVNLLRFVKNGNDLMKAFSMCSS
ncbi:unnamed protein product [Clavelina lepadiformis]|uniref:Uncharacterized protein n=1 Tax=Clavelina lepadiformis TaxID=159417 RepID=A0ABP0F1K2_CLALP